MTRRISRVCKACRAPAAPEYGVPDPCLGTLPNVQNACCGHGSRGSCYVVVIKRDKTGTYLLRGDRARAKMIKLNGNPPPFTQDEHHTGEIPGWEAVG